MTLGPRRLLWILSSVVITICLVFLCQSFVVSFMACGTIFVGFPDCLANPVEASQVAYMFLETAIEYNSTLDIVLCSVCPLLIIAAIFTPLMILGVRRDFTLSWRAGDRQRLFYVLLFLGGVVLGAVGGYIIGVLVPCESTFPYLCHPANGDIGAMIGAVTGGLIVIVFVIWRKRLH